MKNETIIEGIAVDTLLNTDRIECIKISMDEETSTLVTFKDIEKLEALTENPHFTAVSFV